MSRVSADVRRLLQSPLDTFEKLEVVVVLHGAPAHTSSVSELAKQVQLDSDTVARAVDELVRARYVERSGGLIRLAVEPAELAAIGELAALYDDDRILVVRTLGEIAMDKIRGMAARTFADAFQLRKKREGDDG